MKWEDDSTYSYQGCSEFFSDGRWRRHDGCTVAEGMYWFDEDTLFTSILNYTMFEDKDTSAVLIIKLESGEMKTFDFLQNETILYRKQKIDDGTACWGFE